MSVLDVAKKREKERIKKRRNGKKGREGKLKGNLITQKKSCVLDLWRRGL